MTFFRALLAAHGVALLAACTVVASVYKTNPVGLKYSAGLPSAVAAHLQTVAWETAQAFHAKGGRGGL